MIEPHCRKQHQQEAEWHKKPPSTVSRRRGPPRNGPGGRPFPGPFGGPPMDGPFGGARGGLPGGPPGAGPFGEPGDAN